jgi:RNA polymerase sigma-70 factor (ECF subfamily)
MKLLSPTPTLRVLLRATPLFASSENKFFLPASSTTVFTTRFHRSHFLGPRCDRSCRLGAVLLVVYLIFNEGFSAESTGAELSREAIRLGRLLLGLLPEPEVMGLLGLMLLHESRRAARTSSDGDLILLEQQDRSLWNRDQIAEGISLTESALRSRRFGAYTLQAAIAAVHAESPSVASTDWRQITLLYDQLLPVQPSPVVELNRAVAVAMCEGLEQGLALNR